MMDARKVTDLFGGTWEGDYGLFPCIAVAPGRYPYDWKVSVRVNDFGDMFRFRLLRDASGEGPEDDMGPWGDGTDEFGNVEDREMKRMLREWIDREVEADEALRRSEQSVRLWNEAQSIEGTPAETYLRSVRFPGPFPDSLRYHPNCWHPSGPPRPAMVALLTDDLHRVHPEGDLEVDEVPPFPMVHMTYLPQVGSAGDVIAPAEEFLLGEAGSAVEIVKQPPEAKAPILVAESIPSALALAAGILRLLPHPVRIWATLSSEGTKKLRLPVQADPPMPGYGTVWRVQDPRWVIFAPDGGAEGRQAVQDRAEGARLFFRVDIVSAPTGQTWTDVRADMAGKWGWGDRGCLSWSPEVMDHPTLGAALEVEPDPEGIPARAEDDDIPL